jgi:tetratricopeptide (TPR) repeat protein
MNFLQTLGVIMCLCVGSARADTLVILPFFNASKTPNLDWIGESISETIREALAAQGLVALDRDDRQEAYRRLGLRFDAHPTRASVVKIGQALDADQIVYGDFDLIAPPAGVTNTRGSLKITAHILDLKRLKQGPEFAEIGALEDLTAQQAHLAWQTLQFLAPKSAPSETEFRKQWPQIRVDAVENYTRGLLAVNPEQKRKLLLQALRLEPAFSDAAYQLGLLAYSKKDYRTAADYLEKVAKSDVHYRHATFYLGICRYYTGDYAGAQTAFEIVSAQVPLNEVFNNLGAAQSRRNQPAGIENFRKALDGDPSDPAYHFNLGYALWKQGKFADAADRFRAVLDRDPQDSEATIMLGRCLKSAGPRPMDPKSEGLERLKTNYEESAYWQLKAVLQPQKP